MLRISQVAQRYDIEEEYLEPYGHYKAKISLDFLDTLKDKPDGKLVMVTAINPTPAGEGKTTTTIGLGDALNRIGKKAIICLREPSMGPVFGMKGDVYKRQERLYLIRKIISSFLPAMAFSSQK